MINAVGKDYLRLILRSPRRFITMIFIVALGVAFFSGIRATAPDMRITVQHYFDKQNAADIRVVSTMGFDDGDLAALRTVEGVEDIQPGYTVDALFSNGAASLVVTCRSLYGGNNEDAFSRPLLTSGEWPSVPNECLMDDVMMQFHGIEPGDIIHLRDEGNDGGLSRYEYVVSGGARLVDYIEDMVRGTSSKGTGRVAGFLLLPEENFTAEIHTQVFVKAKATGLSRFSDEYRNVMKELCERMETAGKSCGAIRLGTLRTEGQAEINDGLRELQEAKDKLADAERELTDGRAELEKGERELAAERTKYDHEIENGRIELESSLAQLEQARQTLDEKSAELIEGGKKAAEGRADLESKRKELEFAEAGLTVLGAQLEALREQLNLLDPGSPEAAEIAGQMEALNLMYVSGMDEAEAGRALLKSVTAELDTAEAEMVQGHVALNKGYVEYEESMIKYASGLAEYEKGKRDGADALNNGERELSKARQKLIDGQAEFNEKNADALREIADAERELADGQKKLNDLELPVWYSFDWSKNAGFEGYNQNTDRIAAIGLVFPLIFFLVAALVSLTTMTRLVEDERGVIGVYKALGYGRVTIAMKYLLYSGIAAVLGIVLGIAVGTLLFPAIIYDAYGIIYSLPSPLLPVDWPSAVIAAAGAMLCAVLPTFLVCQKELFSTPASLMRPRAPQEGKRILLERVTPIWKRLSFSHKVTCRNVFRYKKRLLMTVFGIAGCTALIFTGFGLRNSISDIAPNQFENIQKYDVYVQLSANAYNDGAGEIIDKATTSAVPVQMTAIDVIAGGKAWSATMTVPLEPDSFGDMIDLHTRLMRRSIPLDDSCVVMTEKIMTKLKLREGDTAVLRNGDHREVTVKVGAPAENYVNHYVYLTPTLYHSLYGEDVKITSVMGIMEDMSAENTESLSQELLKIDGVAATVFNTVTRESFDDMISTLDMVVWVLLISAAALAFVVLMSLTNINIDERRRELATLRVLGFYNNETALYLYRENLILTVIGIASGLVFGLFLCNFVITTAEIDMAMFGRHMHFTTYILSAVFTMVFAAIVNLLTIGIVSKIDMVESMKSIE